MTEILLKLMESRFWPFLLLGLGILAYRLLHKQLNGLGHHTRTNLKEIGERIRSLEHALILVAKNDPERRQIVEVLEKKPNLAEVLDKPSSLSSG